MVKISLSRNLFDEKEIEVRLSKTGKLIGTLKKKESGIILALSVFMETIQDRVCSSETDGINYIKTMYEDYGDRDLEPRK